MKQDLLLKHIYNLKYIFAELVSNKDLKIKLPILNKSKMKKDTKIYLILAGIIIIVVLGVYFLKTSDTPDINEELVKCIASKSIVYSSETCSACKYQKTLFGNSYSLINEVDCLNEGQKCQEAGIRATPTWVINNQQHLGVKTIEELKELTEC